MEFIADAMIHHVGNGSTIVHAHVIFVLVALDLGARNTFCYRLVPHIHLVVYLRDRLGCVAHGNRVQLRAQAE